MKLPIPIDHLLHGKAVEWERLEFLKELDMTEGRSTGIPKILHAMDANGSPPPIFDFDEDHTYFMCRLPVHPQATMPEGLTPEAAGEVTPQVTPQVIAVLGAAENVATAGALQQAAGLKDRVYFLKAYLEPLLKADLIERTIPDKPRSSKQKYRLTAKGRQVISQLERPQQDNEIRYSTQ